jgi:hypothetical protein
MLRHAATYDWTDAQHSHERCGRHASSTQNTHRDVTHCCVPPTALTPLRAGRREAPMSAEHGRTRPEHVCVLASLEEVWQTRTALRSGAQLQAARLQCYRLHSPASHHKADTHVWHKSLTRMNDCGRTHDATCRDVSGADTHGATYRRPRCRHARQRRPLPSYPNLQSQKAHARTRHARAIHIRVPSAGTAAKAKATAQHDSYSTTTP